MAFVDQPETHSSKKIAWQTPTKDRSTIGENAFSKGVYTTFVDHNYIQLRKSDRLRSFEFVSLLPQLRAKHWSHRQLPLNSLPCIKDKVVKHFLRQCQTWWDLETEHIYCLPDSQYIWWLHADVTQPTCRIYDLYATVTVFIRFAYDRNFHFGVVDGLLVRNNWGSLK